MPGRQRPNLVPARRRGGEDGECDGYRELVRGVAEELRRTGASVGELLMQLSSRMIDRDLEDEFSFRVIDCSDRYPTVAEFDELLRGTIEAYRAQGDARPEWDIELDTRLSLAYTVFGEDVTAALGYEPNLVPDDGGGSGGGGEDECQAYALVLLTIVAQAQRADPDVPAYALQWFLQERWPKDEEDLWELVTNCSRSWDDAMNRRMESFQESGRMETLSPLEQHYMVEHLAEGAAYDALLRDVEGVLRRMQRKNLVPSQRRPGDEACARYWGAVDRVVELTKQSESQDAEEAMDEYVWEEWPDERDLWSLVMECSPSYPEDVWALWSRVSAKMDAGTATELEVASTHGKATGAAIEAMTKDVEARLGD